MKHELSAGWRDAAIVCAKCSRKLDGGFGRKGRQPLAKALRKALGLKKGRRAAAGVIETRCLGICPRGAVVAIAAGDPGRWLLVRPDDDLDQVARTLLPRVATDQA